jgi:phosphate transport system protein
MRIRLEEKLAELKHSVLEMGRMVEEELRLALNALDSLDTELATQVIAADNAVNAKRFNIEELCLALIVTQQPAARDLRSIVAVMNMIVDLERMGDQAKGIAKLIPHLAQQGGIDQLPELARMGTLGVTMLNESLNAYLHDNVELARVIAGQDDEIDKLYASVFARIVSIMAETKKTKRIEAAYDMLRVAQELERFGDLATNVAERVVYIATGFVEEINVEPDEHTGELPSEG